MIMAEARGIRGLLHFEMLQLFVPAPVTGYDGQALPYVTSYPDLKPAYKSMKEYIDLVIEDLKYAQEQLAPIDIDELRNKSNFVSGTMRLDNMDYVLFQGVGNIHSNGGKRDNAFGDGFFAFRGYRFNYWSATGLLARVYSYLRDFKNAEIYADTIINDWVVEYQFNLYNSNPKATTGRIDGKRRPEPICAFWNDQVCDNYTSIAGTSYNKMVELKYLLPATSLRTTAILNCIILRPRPTVSGTSLKTGPSANTATRFFQSWNCLKYSISRLNVRHMKVILPERMPRSRRSAMPEDAQLRFPTLIWIHS